MRPRADTQLRRSAQGDGAVPGHGVAAGVVAVAHQANGHQRAGRFAKGAKVVGPDVALVVAPLRETLRPRLDYDFADAVGARAADHAFHRALVAPDIHQRGVGHFFAGEQAREFVDHGVFGGKLAAVALKGQDQAHRRVVAVALAHVGIGNEFGHQPRKVDPAKRLGLDAHRRAQHAGRRLGVCLERGAQAPGAAGGAVVQTVDGGSFTGQLHFLPRGLRHRVPGVPALRWRHRGIGLLCGAAHQQSHKPARQ